MRKLVVLTVAVFVGALAALQIDHWVRRDRAPELRTTESPSFARPSRCGVSTASACGP